MKRLRIPWRSVRSWLQRGADDSGVLFYPKDRCYCVLAQFYGVRGRTLEFNFGQVCERDANYEVVGRYGADSEAFEEAQIAATGRLGRDYLTPGEALLVLDSLPDA